MTENWKQFLTEKVLKECWHSSSLTIHNDTSGQCKKCGTMLYIIGGANRTFTTRNDLMDLYEKIEKDGKWDVFSGGARWKHTMFSVEDFVEMSAWLFCLDQQDYEPRCKMVAEFYGWKEKV